MSPMTLNSIQDVIRADRRDTSFPTTAIPLTVRMIRPDFFPKLKDLEGQTTSPVELNVELWYQRSAALTIFALILSGRCGTLRR
jgi:hypothetical protein